MSNSSVPFKKRNLSFKAYLYIHYIHIPVQHVPAINKRVRYNIRETSLFRTSETAPRRVAGEFRIFHIFFVPRGVLRA